MLPADGALMRNAASLAWCSVGRRRLEGAASGDYFSFNASLCARRVEGWGMTVLAKHTCLAGLAAATTLAAVPLAAQESSGRDMWFGIGLGYQKPDGGARHAEDGYGAQLLLGWRLARQLKAEVAATFSTLVDNY